MKRKGADKITLEAEDIFRADSKKKSDFPLSESRRKGNVSLFRPHTLFLWSLCLSPHLPSPSCRFIWITLWCTCKCKFKAVSPCPLLTHLIESGLHLPWLPQRGRVSVMHTENNKVGGRLCFHLCLPLCLSELSYKIISGSAPTFSETREDETFLSDWWKEGVTSD